MNCNGGFGNWTRLPTIRSSCTGAGRARGSRWTLFGSAWRQHKPSLIVIDTLAGFTQASDLSDYGKATKVLTPYLDVARATGAAIVFVHHARKESAEGPDDAVRASLGSQALAGVADTVMLIRRREGGQRVAETRQRYGRDMEPTLLEFDEDTGRFALGGDPDAARLDEAKVAIIDALAAGPQNTRALREQARARMTGGSNAALDMARNVLLVEERIVKTRGTGTANLFELAPEGAEDDFPDG